MPNGFHEDPQAAQERRERAEQAEQERRANAEKLVDERLEARNKSVTDYYEQAARTKPTPTQREADLMKLGIPVEPEPDGGESDEEFQRRNLESRLPHNNPYENRAVASGESGERAVPRRGPGRPRRDETAQNG
jgi:hypothetical protein